MATESQKGMVQTVLGTIQPSELGPTMTHEHLLINFAVMFDPPPEATTQRLAHEPVSLENLGWILLRFSIGSQRKRWRSC